RGSWGGHGSCRWKSRTTLERHLRCRWESSTPGASPAHKPEGSDGLTVAAVVKCSVMRCIWKDDEPVPTERLWRYFKVERFLESLRSRSLYFAAARQFEDPFEG